MRKDSNTMKSSLMKSLHQLAKYYEMEIYFLTVEPAVNNIIHRQYTKKSFVTLSFYKCGGIGMMDTKLEPLLKYDAYMKSNEEIVNKYAQKCNKTIKKQIWIRLIKSRPATSTLYGLQKTHNIAIRPIASGSNSASHKLVKVIAKF